MLVVKVWKKKKKLKEACCAYMILGFASRFQMQGLPKSTRWKIVTHYPTFPWLLKSQLFNRKYARLPVWKGGRAKGKKAAKEMCEKQGQLCNHKKWHDISNPSPPTPPPPNKAILALNYQTNQPWPFPFPPFSLCKQHMHAERNPLSLTYLENRLYISRANATCDLAVHSMHKRWKLINRLQANGASKKIPEKWH